MEQTLEMHRQRLLAWQALVDAGRHQLTEPTDVERTDALTDEELARFTYVPTVEDAEMIEQRREEARRVLSGAAA